MEDDEHVIDKGWDGLPAYSDKPDEADDAVTVSISTTPGEWLVNTSDSVVVPMSMAELVDALRAHKLSERSLVWRAGMQEWAPVDKVPQLKLAARLPSSSPGRGAQTAPSQAAASPAAPATKPEAPPAASSASAKASPARTTPQPRPGTSRRSTLPFGLPPQPSGSRPSQPKPVATAPAPAREDSDVLAVYARPVATISFDLSPSEPARAPALPPMPAPATRPAPLTAPETLVPTTSDKPSGGRPAAAAAAWSDLSVVAASQYREAKRSSKRLVILSSLGSAAAASLLTLWLASQSAPTPPGAPVSVTRAADPVATAPVAAAPAAPPTDPLQRGPEALAETTHQPAPEHAVPTAPPAPKPVVAKPKSVAPAAAAPAKASLSTTLVRSAPKPSPVRPKPAPKVAPFELEEDAPSTPGSEPNPYDVKLEEEPPARSRPAPARPSADPTEPGRPTEPVEPEASIQDASSPGF